MCHNNGPHGFPKRADYIQNIYEAGTVMIVNKIPDISNYIKVLDKFVPAIEDRTNQLLTTSIIR
jgi:hypothetical protein